MANDIVIDVWMVNIIPECSIPSQNILYMTCRTFREIIDYVIRSRPRQWIKTAVVATNDAVINNTTKRLEKIEKIATTELMHKFHQFVPGKDDFSLMLLDELSFATAQFYGREYLTAVYGKSQRCSNRMAEIFVSRFFPARDNDTRCLLKLMIEWHLTPDERTVWLCIRPPLSGTLRDMDELDTSYDSSAYAGLCNGLLEGIDLQAFSADNRIWHRLLVASLLSGTSVSSVRAVIEIMQKPNLSFGTENDQRFEAMLPHAIALAAAVSLNDTILTLLEPLILTSMKRSTFTLALRFYHDHPLDILIPRLERLFGPTTGNEEMYWDIIKSMLCPFGRTLLQQCPDGQMDPHISPSLNTLLAWMQINRPPILNAETELTKK
jgi:hypothetical protein